MSLPHPLALSLHRHSSDFHPVVPAALRVAVTDIDLSEGNALFSAQVYGDMTAFTGFIAAHLQARGAGFAVGGYAEHRAMYARSPVFGNPGEGGEPRRLHLGIDVWGPAGTRVHAPIAGTVHSCRMNGAHGDYGATVVLRHRLDGIEFHTLYGHLDAASLSWKPGMAIAAGQGIGAFGVPEENGNWPPHLHFQAVVDMEGAEGDYPGVCRLSEQAHYLSNCPDPSPLLGLP